MMSEQFYIGIDVGTGSARAGIFNQKGKLISQASQDIKIWKPKTDFVQQSSENIWGAICHSVKQAMKESNLEPEQIAGIGFDATCSLVVLGEDNKPLTVSPNIANEQNVIVWMDHRTKGEAEEINQKGHEVLKYVGGVIRPGDANTQTVVVKAKHAEHLGKSNSFF